MCLVFLEEDSANQKNEDDNNDDDELLTDREMVAAFRHWLETTPSSKTKQIRAKTTINSYVGQLTKWLRDGEHTREDMATAGKIKYSREQRFLQDGLSLFRKFCRARGNRGILVGY